MPSFADRFLRWARQLFTPPTDPFRPTEVIDQPDEQDLLIYRLKRWPKLPSSSMSTDVTRALSVMSTRPVNRRWLANNTGLTPGDIDGMLHRLVEQGAVEVTDARKYQAHARTA